MEFESRGILVEILSKWEDEIAVGYAGYLHELLRLILVALVTSSES
jgi:hypothetical protein